MLFGVQITATQKNAIQSVLMQPKKVQEFQSIVTLNPEMLLAARNDLAYTDTLNQAQMRVIDGMGLALYMQWSGARSVERYTGVDLLEDLLYSANRLSYSVAFIMPPNALSTERDIERALKKHYPNISHRVYTHEAQVIPQMKNDMPDYVIVSSGVPAQEVFLAEYRAQVSYGIGIGIGGAVDFLTERIKRAPMWMQYSGIEWLYRLLQEPKRLPRIVRAVMLFPAYAVYEQLKKTV